MADLHQTHNPDPKTGIDVVGWVFSAVVAAVIGCAVLIAYEANGTTGANAPVAQLAAH